VETAKEPLPVITVGLAHGLLCAWTEMCVRAAIIISMAATILSECQCFIVIFLLGK
jgi:hypothetical protein